MAKTSTARANGGKCPLCGEQFSDDSTGQGYVRHLARPRGASIFTDTSKVEQMVAAGDLAPDYRDMYSRTGRCPFQEGRRD